MQHHIELLSALIISFYILTTKFLCYIFSNGHAMAHYGGCHTPDILVKCRSIYMLLISPLFSKMGNRSTYIYIYNISFYRGKGSRGGGGEVRRVVFREESEEEMYMIQSISFQDQVSISF